MKAPTVQLAEVAEFRGGGTPSKKVPEYWMGDIPFVTCTDLTDIEVGRARAHITREAVDASATQLIPAGNLLVLTRTSVGKVAINAVDVCTSQDFVNVLPDKRKVDTRYLLHFLLSKQQYLVSRQRGATIKGVTKGVVTGLELPLPSLAEQRRIAAILDKAGAIRRKRTKATKMVDELLRSVFLEMFGDPVPNPKAWPRAELNEVAEIGSGIMKGRDFGTRQVVSLPYLRVANVQDGYLDLDDIKTIEVPVGEVDKYRLKAGDVLMTEGGDYDKLGRGAIWRGQVVDCVHQNHIYRIRPDSNVLAPEFLSALGGSPYGKRYFMSCAKQTTGIATINKTQLGRFPVLLPPVELQRRYGKAVERHEAILNRFGKGTAVTDDTQRSLQQRFFNDRGPN